MYTYVFDDKEVVVLIIQEYPLKPLVMSGKYFVRVQNSNHLMTTDMIADMTLKTKYRSFDMFLVEGKTIEDLDQVKILKAIDCINRLREYPLNRDVSTFLKKFELVK
jgi:ATP-dependent DNA helicase RecG